MAYDEADVRWSLAWRVMWLVNVLALVALHAAGVRPSRWATAFAFLFLVPEMVGLARHRDSLPPLTFVVRRYLPEWLPPLLTVALGVWLGAVWWQTAEHPLVAVVIVGAFVGWLIEHWQVTYRPAPCSCRC